jgi:hypothetical protein
MATQFIVRSEGHKQALSLKTVIYDGLQIGRLQENGIQIFELPSDADIIIELVVKRKSSSAAESNLKPPSDSRGKRKASDLTPGDSVNQAKQAGQTREVSVDTTALGKMSWENRLLQLVKFKEKYGHVQVPARYQQNPQLGQWVTNQRSLHKSGKLKEERIDKLNEIGFSWEVGSEWSRLPENGRVRVVNDWNDHLGKLLEFKEKHGHVLVPQRYKQNTQLGQWVADLRQRRKKGSLSEEQIAQLDEIDFTWKVGSGTNDRQWEDNLLQLLEFKEKHGHMLVSSKEHPQLGKWVINQRQLRKNGSLKQDRIDKLNDVGFVWEVGKKWKECLWEDRLSQLLEFKEKHGHTVVLHDYGPNSELAQWVTDQRELHEKGTLKKERIAKLNGVGFKWKVEVGSGVSGSED